MVAESLPPVLVKPRLRGVLHTYAAVVSVVLGTVLCLLARTARARVGVVVYAASVTLLFGTSAIYHRRTWAPRARSLMRRLDHSMIFVFIAGTYTAFSLTLLHGETATVVLWVVWVGAAVGTAARMAWLQSPRWLIVPLYIGLGWVALFVMRPLLHGGGVAVLTLIVVGGLFYTCGAVVYALRRPDPVPAVFGYHEVFHLCTLVAAVCHYVGVFLAVFSRAAAT